MATRCDVCGQGLAEHGNQVKVGWREYCGPDGSACHKMALRASKWTLTADEANALFDHVFGEEAS